MGRLLPVGVSGGTISGFDGIKDGSGLVRHGEQLLYLDAPRFRLWRGIEVAPESEGLLAWAEQDGIADAKSLLAILTDAWLVIELRQEHRIQAARLAVRLTGECLGNGTKRAPGFGVSGRRGAVVRVGLVVYEVLLRSDGAQPIDAVCRAVQGNVPSDQPPAVDQFFEALPVLVRAGAAGLDLAVR
jgi:hypothetical protein